MVRRYLDGYLILTNYCYNNGSNIEFFVRRDGENVHISDREMTAFNIDDPCAPGELNKTRWNEIINKSMFNSNDWMISITVPLNEVDNTVKEMTTLCLDLENTLVQHRS